MKNNKEGGILTDLYRIRFPKEILNRKNQIWQVLCKDFFQNYISLDDTVIDVACGYGEFINNIVAKRKIAVDLNNDTRSHLENDIEFYQVPATELSTYFNEEADVIFTSNFLEHLPDKETLNKFLSEVQQSLRVGGKYIILGPNLRYLPGEYWDFYDHSLGLTHLSLIEALRLKEFKIKVVYDRFLPYTTQGSLPTHPILVKIYIKIPFIWRFFGKQFFIVAEK